LLSPHERQPSLPVFNGNEIDWTKRDRERCLSSFSYERRVSPVVHIRGTSVGATVAGTTASVVNCYFLAIFAGRKGSGAHSSKSNSTLTRRSYHDHNHRHWAWIVLFASASLMSPHTQSFPWAKACAFYHRPCSFSFNRVESPAEYYLKLEHIRRYLYSQWSLFSQGLPFRNKCNDRLQCRVITSVTTMQFPGRPVQHHVRKHLWNSSLRSYNRCCKC
jgi:hypothetical protein